MKELPSSFRNLVRSEFRNLLQDEAARIPSTERLRIDLHCHDYNSDVPDELWGRILRLPETRVKSEELLSRLQRSGVGAYTITNHNNARSCWTLQDQGVDLLAGAEFTCHFPDMDFDAHVLAYGFTPEQETQLNQLRSDATRFLDFTMEHDIPTILPHPLYLYHNKPQLPMECYEKLALMFERFEVMNGQRDVFQNLLVAEWLQGMDEEVLESWGKKHGISPRRWCRDPYRKRMTGGSDDHFALFAGGAGTLLQVPNLQERLRREAPSQIALAAIRQGNMAPYGTVAEDEKLAIAFLDYFCQVSMNMQDPGLLRMFLHRGDLKDKLICLGIGNAMQELKRHKYTLKFLQVFHDSLRGHEPGLLTKWSVHKDYRPMLEDLQNMAKAAQAGPESHEAIMANIENMFRKINQLISQRISSRVGNAMNGATLQALSVDEMVRRFELPSHFRVLASPGKVPGTGDMTSVNVADLLDQLSFPALFYGIMGGARFMSARVLHHDRATVNAFSDHIGKHRAPARVLWLTDTLFDKNGVASVLQSTLREVERRNLPIDFLICSDEIQPREHLRVVSSIGGFSLPSFSEQQFKVPNLMDVHNVFLDGNYDRILCSTEALMGVVGLYLKQAFNVPAYFFMHTDWLDYVQRMTTLDQHALDRVRRILRALYRSFDGIFVLNHEHQNWLSSRAIGMNRRRIFETAHWTEGEFAPLINRKPFDEKAPVILFAGRLSQEKGIFDLPLILQKVRQIFPGARLQIAGSGVGETALREALPDAEFLGWINSQDLAQAYGAADFLLLPSRFDTFGCVVIEAMACGLPVAAYNSKGPRDIIEHGVSGVLAEDPDRLGSELVQALMDPSKYASMRESAIRRAACYNKEPIMNQMLADMGVLLQPS